MPPEQPQFSPQPQPHAQMPQMPQAGRSRRKWLFIAGGVILLVVIAAGVFVWMKSRDEAASQLTAVTVPPVAGQLSAAEVAQMDKDATFWGYFKNAAMQQQLVTEHKDYDTAVPNFTTYRKIGFDYQTKQLVAAVDVETASLPGYRNKNRCYDGKNYSKTGAADAQWRDSAIPGQYDPTCGMLGEPLYYLTDGTNAGGLSLVQADTFVNFLRGQEGLANIRSLTLEEHGGKQYLKYSVDFVPIPTFDGYGANFWFGRAIQEAGINPDELPYGKSGVIGGGTHLEYYVDPSTQLPAYSKVSALPMKNDAGQDQPLDDFHVVETIYHFGTATFDVVISNNADLTFNW